MPSGLSLPARWWGLGLAVMLAVVATGCGSDEIPVLAPDVVLLQAEGGEVTVDRGEEEGAEIVTDITELTEGDEIVTGAGARAYLLNGGGHVLLLTEGTELGFSRFFKIAGAVMREIVVEQRSGTIFFSIPALPNGVFFQVRAGEVAMLVQGPASEFAVTIGANDTGVKVFSGEVDVLQRELDGNVNELQAGAGDIVRLPIGKTLELTSGGQLLPDEDELLSDLREQAAAVREVAELNHPTPTAGPLQLRVSTPTPSRPDRPPTPAGPGEPGGPDAVTTPVGTEIGIAAPAKPGAPSADAIGEPEVGEPPDGGEPEAPSAPGIEAPEPVATPPADK